MIPNKSLLFRVVIFGLILRFLKQTFISKQLRVFIYLKIASNTANFNQYVAYNCILTMNDVIFYLYRSRFLHAQCVALFTR